MLVLDKNFNGSLSRDIADYPEGIVIVINKPYRWTSADVIRKVKFCAIRHFGKKNLKVGHAGTLDPLATGVLLVCIGNACKMAESFQATHKEYVAGVCFGATTPSYDLEKDVDRRFPTDNVSLENLRAILPDFIGEQDQVAPLFSAKQVDGVRAYELARKLHKQGKTLDEAAAELLRVGRINITDMELLEYCNNYTSQEKETQSCTEETILGELKSQSRASGGQEGSEGSVHPRTEAVGGAHLWEGLSPKGEVLQTPPAHQKPQFQENQKQSGQSSASNRINVAEVPEGLPVATIRVACSKGTYIRALARDLGERLGSGAFLSSLQRSASGSFRVENALEVEQAVDILSR